MAALAAFGASLAVALLCRGSVAFNAARPHPTAVASAAGPPKSDLEGCMRDELGFLQVELDLERVRNKDKRPEPSHAAANISTIVQHILDAQVGDYLRSRKLDTGDTAFMFISTALVQLMTPGLAFFYGGLVRSTNIVSIMLQSFICLGIVFVMWYLFLFSMVFGKSLGGIVGDPFSYPLLINVWVHYPFRELHDSHIPAILYATYQGMFAVISPALMTGAFADRLRWGPFVAFVVLWMVFVYAPVAHWVWGGGWMQRWGVWDWAGGIVVHTTSGFSALASLVVIGPRRIADDPEATQPHNVPFVALGTALLMFGWFGFNGGSAFHSNGDACLAALNSQIAASVAMLGWSIIEALEGRKPGLVGACVGAIAGLATVTPAAGYVPLWGAVVIGVVATVVCYSSVLLVSIKLKLDDALDVWGVHGMGGFSGTILVGILAERTVDIDAANPGPQRSFKLLLVQVSCACIVAAYCFAVTCSMLWVMDRCVRLRVPKRYERNLDLKQHGEAAYNYAVYASRERFSSEASEAFGATDSPGASGSGL